MSPKEIFSQLSLRILNLYLKSFTFCLYFILVCMYVHVWIRIHKAPEYGSGSTTLGESVKILNFFITGTVLYNKLYTTFLKLIF